MRHAGTTLPLVLQSTRLHRRPYGTRTEPAEPPTTSVSNASECPASPHATHTCCHHTDGGRRALHLHSSSATRCAARIVGWDLMLAQAEPGATLDLAAARRARIAPLRLTAESQDGLAGVGSHAAAISRRNGCRRSVARWAAGRRARALLWVRDWDPGGPLRLPPPPALAARPTCLHTRHGLRRDAMRGIAKVSAHCSYNMRVLSPA